MFSDTKFFIYLSGISPDVTDVHIMNGQFGADILECAYTETPHPVYHFVKHATFKSCCILSICIKKDCALFPS